MGRPPLGRIRMTSAQRQKRRRDQTNIYRMALEEISGVRTAKDARDIAKRALADAVQQTSTQGNERQ